LSYVLENTSNNQFARLGEEAYRFIGMLDGTRSISDVWDVCNEQFGDDALTQPEVLQLLGQLYAMNLLYVDLAPDSEVLFDRYKKRVRRQITSYLTNVLFVRVPLWDPDHFLNRWVGLFGKPFGWAGLVIWLVLASTGGYFAISNIGGLVDSASNVLDPNNLIVLYLTFAVIKVMHEFGHAFSCKHFGRLNGTGGEVHKMGIMFLVFFPLPYVDASSAWAFKSKWHRAIVGMAGVLVDLAVASVAAIVWANTSAGTVHAIAYNAIFVASISTILFNGNFLLRFDAYYVLTDLIETPNLSQRSRDYLYYLVRKYAFGISRAWSPAQTSGERYWFIFYGFASTGFRVYISVRILLYLNDALPDALSIVVPVLIFSALVGWLFMPLGKLVRYLAVSPELGRDRFRAVGVAVLFIFLLFGVLGFLRVPDYSRIEGIVEPVRFTVLHAETGGFVTAALPSNTVVSAEAAPLIESDNYRMGAEQRRLEAERDAVQIRYRLAMTADLVAAQIHDEELIVIDNRLEQLEERIDGLILKSPIDGMWVSPDIDSRVGSYLNQGEPIGLVADMSEMIIRATAVQNVAANLIEQARPDVELRRRGRPELTLDGTIVNIFPAGHQELPSESLGYAAGGAVPVDIRDPSGKKTTENFFEIRIKPDFGDVEPWRVGQRVHVRVRLNDSPLASQLWHYARQLFQRRFRI
jgi:putative peptide zinc metalloprotease protein